MTQHGSIKDRILADIAAGALPFGARLTLDELATRYDASHMPVREALRALLGAGVLETGPGRSARIREIDAEFVENLFATRTALEVMLVRRTAQHVTPLQIQALQAIEDALEARLAAADFVGALAENRRLHAAINDIAANTQAKAIIDQHWWLMAALWQRVGYGPERYAGVVSDHRHLLRALAQRDADAAGTLMGAHVIKAKFELLERMATQAAVPNLRDAS